MPEHKSSKLIYASIGESQKVHYKFRSGGESHEELLDFSEFIDVKGWKAMGNKLVEAKVTSVKKIEAPKPAKPEEKKPDSEGGDLKPGDTIDLFGA